MRVSKYFVIVAASLLLAGSAFAQGGAPYVFVSNPDAGQIVKVVDDTTYTVLFEHRRTQVEDLVVGPDDLLYACAPEDGLVFRFDPESVVGDPFSIGDVTVIYDGPLALQCGWFSDLGDLFTTGSDDAVWVFNGLVPLDPPDPAPPWPPAPTLLVEGTNFGGQGVTQAGPGDLLYVSQNQGAVYSLPFDPIFRFDSPLSDGAATPITGLADPVGVARSGNDTVFVTSGTVVKTYGQYNCGDISGFGDQTPQFLQFTSDDVLYVASTSRQAGTLWRVDYTVNESLQGECTTPSEIITFERPVWKPSMSGVAVPRTFRGVEPVGPGQIGDFAYDDLFNFKDHVYRLEYIPVPEAEGDPSCGPAIVANEVRPDCLEALINDLTVGDDNEDIFAEGVSLTYAGDGGVAQLYSIDGSCDDDVAAIAHGLSAFTRLAQNPRIVRCGWTLIDPEDTIIGPLPDYPEGFQLCRGGTPWIPDPNEDFEFSCQLIDVDFFFPFDGVIPDDGDFRGSKAATASSFSEYFFADISLADDNDTNNNTPACFCGWESPLPNAKYLADDPFFAIPDLDNPDFTVPLPVYNAGSSVPIKFRAAVDLHNSCGTVSDPCTTGAPDGYLTEGAFVLLSVARVYNNDKIRAYDPKFPDATGSSTVGVYFGNPNSPSTPFHYNLDTTEYDPGVYQAVAIAITDNFEVEWTYFRLQ